MNLNEIKERINNSNSIDEIFDIENEVINDYRNKYYNELLKDDDILEKLSKILDVNKDLVPNILAINGNSPIDNNEDKTTQEN